MPFGSELEPLRISFAIIERGIGVFLFVWLRLAALEARDGDFCSKGCSQIPQMAFHDRLPMLTCFPSSIDQMHQLTGDAEL